MTLLQRFWYEYLLSGYKDPTEDDQQEAKHAALDMSESKDVPYLFPQWLLTEANYLSTSAYAVAYWEQAWDSGKLVTLSQIKSVPDEFRLYINKVIDKMSCHP